MKTRAEQRKERDALIAKLGMKPEDPTDRYAETTGELWGWVAEEFGVEAAEACGRQ